MKLICKIVKTCEINIERTSAENQSNYYTKRGPGFGDFSICHLPKVTCSCVIISDGGNMNLDCFLNTRTPNEGTSFGR
jgi:hypothetical protein